MLGLDVYKRQGNDRPLQLLMLSIRVPVLFFAYLNSDIMYNRGNLKNILFLIPKLLQFSYDARKIMHLYEMLYPACLLYTSRCV